MLKVNILFQCLLSFPTNYNRNLNEICARAQKFLSLTPTKYHRNFNLSRHRDKSCFSLTPTKYHRNGFVTR